MGPLSASKFRLSHDLESWFGQPTYADVSVRFTLTTECTCVDSSSSSEPAAAKRQRCGRRCSSTGGARVRVSVWFAPIAGCNWGKSRVQMHVSILLAGCFVVVGNARPPTIQLSSSPHADTPHTTPAPQHVLRELPAHLLILQHASEWVRCKMSPEWNQVRRCHGQYTLGGMLAMWSRPQLLVKTHLPPPHTPLLVTTPFSHHQQNEPGVLEVELDAAEDLEAAELLLRTMYSTADVARPLRGGEDYTEGSSASGSGSSESGSGSSESGSGSSSDDYRAPPSQATLLQVRLFAVGFSTVGPSRTDR